MPKYEKTAKDRAWDQERLKLKGEIANWINRCAEKQFELNEKNEEIAALSLRVTELEAAITELTKGDMTPDEAIKKMRKQAELADTLGFLVKGVPGW